MHIQYATNFYLIQDIIEQVFHELGIGSVTCLHDFYQKRVLNYHQHMEELCQQLDTEYEKLKEPMVQKQPDTLSVIRSVYIVC